MFFFYQFQLSRVRKELNLVKPIFSAILFDLLQNAVDKLIRERRAKNIQDPKTFPHSPQLLSLVLEPHF